jgi:hypothetical protein
MGCMKAELCSAVRIVLGRVHRRLTVWNSPRPAVGPFEHGLSLRDEAGGTERMVAVWVVQAIGACRLRHWPLHEQCTGHKLARRLSRNKSRWRVAQHELPKANRISDLYGRFSSILANK